MSGTFYILICFLCCSLALCSTLSNQQKLPSTRRTSIPQNVLPKLPKSEGSIIKLDEDTVSFDDSPSSSSRWGHYTCPPQSIDELRKRYGDGKNEWSVYETRQFYKQQLPRALQVDGFLGLSLEERAKMAARSRNVIRRYARERCNMPAGMAAKFFDGIRHLRHFGYWATDGLSWDDLKSKYAKEAVSLNPSASEEEIELTVYRMILDKSCSTNKIFDDYCDKKISLDQLINLMRSLTYFDSGNYKQGKENKALQFFSQSQNSSTAGTKSNNSRLLTPIQLLLLLDALAIGTNLTNM